MTRRDASRRRARYDEEGGGGGFREKVFSFRMISSTFHLYRSAPRHTGLPSSGEARRAPRTRCPTAADEVPDRRGPPCVPGRGPYFFLRLSGLVASILTVSPMPHAFSSSCACVFAMDAAPARADAHGPASGRDRGRPRLRSGLRTGGAAGARAPRRRVP